MHLKGKLVTSRWYVLCCKAHKEQVVLQRLQHLELETYFPCSLTPNGRTGKLELRPYFPGYLFVRVDLDEVNLSTFQWMPNTEGLVRFGVRPAFVPDHILQSVRRHVEKANTRSEIRILASPGSLMSGEPEMNPGEYSAFLSLELSSDERVSGLLSMLEELSLPPASG